MSESKLLPPEEEKPNPMSVTLNSFAEITSHLDKKFEKGYAAKNPGFVQFLMGFLASERDRAERLEQNGGLYE